MKIIKKSIAHTLLVPIYLGFICALIILSPVMIMWWAIDEVVK